MTAPGTAPGGRTWRIAFLRRRFSPTGGAERYLVRLASALAARGHDMALYCEAWEPEESPFREVFRIDSHDPVGYAREVLRQPLRRRHDLVFSLERVPGADLYRAGDGLHAEWLARRAEVHPFLGQVRTLLRAKNRDLCRLEARVFAPGGVRRVICNSRMVADEIVRRFGFASDRIDLIPNGVPYEQFSAGDRAAGRRALGFAPDDDVVLLVGAGAERKGHAWARRMVAALGPLPGGRRARLVIVDAPPPVPMPDVYAAADVFLLPTLYDPFANVTLEALAAGLPVITTAQNGAAEILTPGLHGFVLPEPRAVAEAAGHLRRLAEDGYRATFREPAQALARQYDLERNVAATLEAIERAVAAS